MNSETQRYHCCCISRRSYYLNRAHFSFVDLHSTSLLVKPFVDRHINWNRPFIECHKPVAYRNKAHQNKQIFLNQSLAQLIKYGCITLLSIVNIFLCVISGTQDFKDQLSLFMFKIGAVSFWQWAYFPPYWFPVTLFI